MQEERKEPRQINEPIKDALDHTIGTRGSDIDPDEQIMVRVDPNIDPLGRSEITFKERYSEGYVKYCLDPSDEFEKEQADEEDDFLSDPDETEW